MTQKPFIHLIKSPYHHYVFDVNTNSILRVSKELSEYLQAEQIGKAAPTLSQSAAQEMDSLKQNGYLKTKHPKKIENPQIRDVEYLLEYQLNMLTLQVTQQCNFRCSYCTYSTGDGIIQRGHSSKSMSIQTAKQAVDFFKKRVRHRSKINIGYYGGEPLIEWPLIKEVTKYAQKCLEGKELTFSMTTNATLLTEEMARFFTENHFSLLISLDGPKEIHDRSRRFAGNGEGTFDSVIAKIEEMKRKVPGFQDILSFNSVIDPCNPSACISEFFRNMHTDARASTLNPPPGTSLVYPMEYLREMKKASLIGCLHHLGLVPNDKMDLFSTNQAGQIHMNMDHKMTLKELPDVCGHAGPCIPGLSRMFVDVQGNIFPCERCSETSGSMKIGHIAKGFDYNNIKKVMGIASLTEDSCKNCWALFKCDICAAQISEEKEFSAAGILSKCANVRNNAEENLRQVIAVSEVQKMAHTLRQGERS